MEKKMVNFNTTSKEYLDKSWQYYDSLPDDLKELVLSIKMYDFFVCGETLVFMEIELSRVRTQIDIPVVGHIFKSAGIRNDYNFVTFVVGEIDVTYKIKVTKDENHLFFALNKD